MLKKNFLGIEIVNIDREEIIKEKPYEFMVKCKLKKGKDCVFCKIREKEKDRIILDEKGFVIVKNKYPIIEESYVIIHDNHNGGLESKKYCKELEIAVDFITKRAKEFGKYPLIFKNHGFLAGASIAHAHEQGVLIDKKDKPKINGKKLKEFIEKELKSERRINDYSFCPSSSIKPYEVWVLLERWENIAVVFKAMKKVLGNFDYNFVMYYSENNSFPSFLQIIPRTNIPSGIELSLKRFINPVAPEKSAKRLREALEKG